MAPFNLTNYFKIQILQGFEIFLKRIKNLLGHTVLNQPIIIPKE